ncbi:MAG: hypothetical protein ACPGU1_05450 [Myxococcota bacterium]
MEVHQHWISARLGYAFKGGWYVAGAVGASLGGSLESAERLLTFEPGVVATLQTGVVLMEADGWLPFIESSLNVSASFGGLREDDGLRQSWTAVDVRLGATTGWRVADLWVPYVAFRVFGGPVFWRDGGEDRVGSDLHHFQVAIGSSLSFYGVDLFVDWGLPIGEAGLSAGLGYRF